MKFLKSPYLVLAGLICCMTMQPNFAAPTSDNPSQVDESASNHKSYRDDRIIVRFREAQDIKGTSKSSAFNSADSLLAVIGAKRAERYDFGHTSAAIEVLQLDGKMSVNDAITLLTNSGLVIYAEPDRITYEEFISQPIEPVSQLNTKSGIQSKMALAPEDSIPNDPRFPDQWSLHNTIDNSGTEGADISMLEAWEVSTGTGDTIVGIIDSGIYSDHEDLAANMWVNPGEIADNGIDDDGNGVIDDIHGMNCIDDNGNSDPTVEFDDDNDPVANQNGTNIAGIVAAVRNNELGIAGVNPSAKLLSLKYSEFVLRDDEDGEPTLFTVSEFSDAVQCLDYAVKLKRDYGVNVKIVITPSATSDSIQDAISLASESGMLIVSAYSGSGAVQNNVIQVTETDDEDIYDGSSSADAAYVHLAAPSGVISTEPDFDRFEDWVSDYGRLFGAQSSAAHVAGAAALIWDNDPTITPLGMKNLLMWNGDSLPSLADRTISGNRLNVFKALTCQPGNPVLHVTQAPDQDFIEFSGRRSIIQASYFDCGNRVVDASITVQLDNGDSSFQLLDNGINGDSTANDGIYTGIWNVTNPQEVTTLTISSASQPQNVSTFTGEVRDSLGIVDIEIDRLLDTEGTRCGLATHRFSTSSTFNGKELDLLVEILDTQSIAENDDGGCIEVRGGAIGMTIKGSPDVDDGLAYTDVKLSIVEAGTNSPVRATGLLMTGLDLDKWLSGSSRSLTDDIYVRDASSLFVSSDSEVTASFGNFINGAYTKKLTGTDQRNCVDLLDNPEIECRASAVWDAPENGISEIYFRIQNDDATSHTSDPSNARFFLISLRILDATGLDNQPPLARITGGPTAGPAPLTSNFSSELSGDFDGQIVSRVWDFGDGTTSTEISPQHVFTENGAYTVSLVVEDNEGAIGNSIITVVVDDSEDTTPPVITLNGSSNIELDVGDLYTEAGATAIDDRDLEVNVVITGVVDTSQAGEYTVEYTATDSSGNSATIIRTVKVTGDDSDTTPPVITLNGDAAISLEEGDAYNEAGASATDETDGDVAVSISGNVDTTTPGVYTLTYTATDAAGNTSSVTRTVTVTEVEDPDTVAPVITLNGDAAITLSVGDSYVEAGATAIDEVDGEVAVSISGAVDTTTAGTYTLTYSAVDAAGNASSVSRVVTVNAIIIPDTTAPVVTLLGSSTISIDVGGDFTDPGATAMDDRDGDVAVSVDGSVDTSTAGTYTLTYSASDMAGNTGSATRTITVNTVIIPNVAPVADLNSSTTAGLAPLSIDFDASGSSDSDGEIVSYEWDFGDSTSDSGTTTSHVYTDAGNYVVTLTVTDNEGATSTATTTINVNADVEVVSYLKVVDTEGGYHHLKIGHNPDNLWKPKVSPADGNDTLHIRIRAESDIDWDKLEVVPQSQDWRGVVSLGDYIDGNPEGWIDVNIPLSDYPEGAFDNITLLSFFTRGIDPFSICIERIEFVGSNNFLWFGAPDKLDVAFDTPFNASVVTVDPSGPTHLQVIDTTGGWQHLKIGHNPDNLWNPKISPVGNNDSITIRVKAGDGVDWNRLQIIPQGKPERGRATLGDYLPANTDGWFDIVIPLADYSAGAFDDISLISIFGSGTDPFEIGLESIIFTGGDEFIWFGAPGTSSVSLETDWFTQLIVASQTEAAQSRMAKKGLLDIQEAQEPAAPVVEVASAGGGGSLPLQMLFALMLLVGLRKLR